MASRERPVLQDIAVSLDHLDPVFGVILGRLLILLREDRLGQVLNNIGIEAVFGRIDTRIHDTVIICDSNGNHIGDAVVLQILRALCFMKAPYVLETRVVLPVLQISFENDFGGDFLRAK